MRSFTIRGPQAFPEVTIGLIGHPCVRGKHAYLVPPGLYEKRLARVQIIPLTINEYIHTPALRTFETETVIERVIYEKVFEYGKPIIKICVPATTALDHMALVWLHHPAGKDTKKDTGLYCADSFTQVDGQTQKVFAASSNGLCLCQLLVMNPGDIIRFARLSEPQTRTWKKDEDFVIHWDGQRIRACLAYEILSV